MASRASPTDDAVYVRALHRALDGFAGVGTAIVGLIVVTGFVNGLFLVGLDNVMRAASGLWGQLMLAKIVLFLGMLVMAAANRFRLTPGLERAIERRDHAQARSEEHTSELQSLMRISYAVFCLKKKKKTKARHTYN